MKYQGGTIAYSVFLYREELNRKNSRPKRLKSTKIDLTDKLVSKGVRNLKTCSMDDLKAINRELLYKRKLECKLKPRKKKEKVKPANDNPEEVS